MDDGYVPALLASRAPSELAEDEFAIATDLASIRCLALLQIASALKAIIAMVFTYLWLGLTPPTSDPSAPCFILLVVFCVGTALLAGWRLSSLGRHCLLGSALLCGVWIGGTLSMALSSYPVAFWEYTFSGIVRGATALFLLPAGCAIALATLAAAVRRLVENCGCSPGDGRYSGSASCLDGECYRSEHYIRY